MKQSKQSKAVPAAPPTRLVPRDALSEVRGGIFGGGISHENFTPSSP